MNNGCRGICLEQIFGNLKKTKVAQILPHSFKPKKFITFIILLLIWKFCLIVISAIAPHIIPSHLLLIPGWAYRIKFPEIIWAWANFDGDHYIKIADLGYGLLEFGFFPLYPLLIRIGFQIFHLPYLISALTISHISFLLALGFSALLLMLDEQKIPILFFLIIFLFPTSFFYTAAYNDALFFCLATITLFLARKKLWLIAGVAGGLATLTRLNGLALIFFILSERYFGDTLMNSSFEQIVTHFRLEEKPEISNFFKKFIPMIIPITIIIAAFVGYLIWVQLQFGHWWLVFDSMKVWSQNKLTFPPQVVFRYIKILFWRPTFQFPYLVAFGELLFVTLYGVLLWKSFFVLRTSYWVFFFVSLLIPAMTGTFQGMPRYGLHLYPMYLSYYYLLNRQSMRVQIVVLGISAFLLILYEMLFLRGYFVA